MRRAPALLGVCRPRAVGGHALRTGRDSRRRTRQVFADLDRIRRRRSSNLLVDGKVLKMEDVPIGVTKPQRATLEGTAMRFAWKPLRPGYSKGFMESYKAEIAAYKLDRMLDMHMVPPIVERKIDGQTGAAVYWVENVKGWSVEKPPQGPEPTWSLQLTRMKMFDLLIANIDRNQGNLIYDADWHLFLIDHSRAFIDKKDLKSIAPLGRVDRKLWEKMQALTIEDLDRGLEKWVGDKEKKALLTPPRPDGQEHPGAGRQARREVRVLRLMSGTGGMVSY